MAGVTLSNILSDYFDRNGGASSPASLKLSQAINESNSLLTFINSAVTTGIFTSITSNARLTDAAFNVNSNTLYINTDFILANNKVELAATLAHEVQHAFDADRIRNNANTFANSPLDTNAAATFAGRQSITEARAEMRAWNTVVETLTQQNGGAAPTLQQIYESCPTARVYVDRQETQALKGSGPFNLTSQ